jgi:hypothetical protein
MFEGLALLPPFVCEPGPPVGRCCASGLRQISSRRMRRRRRRFEKPTRSSSPAPRPPPASWTRREKTVTWTQGYNPLGQFLVSNYQGPALFDIVAAAVSILAMYVLLKFWQPKRTRHFEGSRTELLI